MSGTLQSPERNAAPPVSPAAAHCNVSDYITEQARTRPEALAIVEDASGRRVTFSELERSIQSIAAGFERMGIRQGTRTVLAVKPSIEFVALVFALFRVAAVPIVVDPGMGRKNMLVCIGEAKPEALVGIPLAHVLSRLFRAPFASLSKRVSVVHSWLWGGRTYRQLVQTNADGFSAPRTRPDDLAAILFTSGATGVPKGVEYEHGMFDGQLRAIRDYFGIEPGEIDVPCFALFALFTVGMGCTIVLPDMDFSKPARCDPSKIVAAISKHKATLTFGSPAVWARVAPWLHAQGQRFPESLNRILIAGASVPLSTHGELAALLPSGRVFTPYGATESLPVACIDGTTLLADFGMRMRSGSGTCVGRPMPGVSVRINRLGATGLSPLPQGQIGEIVVSSPTTTRRYFNRDTQTAASKIANAGDSQHPYFHRMGDVGFFDAEGYLWFCGRAAHVVNSKGKPLFPDQVEGVFNSHAGVVRSALIGHPVFEDGYRAGIEQSAAVVVQPKSGASPLSREDLARELVGIAARHEATQGIDRVLFDSDFPLDVRHNAKIDRLALARRHASSMKGGA